MQETNQKKTPIWLQMRNQASGPEELLALVAHRGNAATPILELCRCLGVGLWDSDMVEGGCLEMNTQSGIANIRVQRASTRHRKRFTIAHELAHLMLHEFDGKIHRDARGYPQILIEHEASRFAAALLMPEHLVKIVAPLYKYNTSEMAQVFNVSKEAMAYRFQNIMSGVHDPMRKRRKDG